ncbi:MAG TPA: glycosyltransferase family 9 protein [Phycisphaerales bacterium]|nr:glycosyltransferase family 9 protein [Phycisphaerales bacterium]
MEAPSRILLIRPSALGDVCRTVPVLASLRRAFPSARIDWLVQDSFADAVRAHPALTGVVPFARGRMGADLRAGRAGGLRGLVRSLRAAGYDLAIDAQGLFRSGFFAWASGARRRIGYADAREGAGIFCNERCRVSAEAHTVERMLSLAKAAGADAVEDMRLYAPAEDERAVESDGRFAGRFVVISPTSRWAGKRWPAERFAVLAGALLRHGAERVVVVGSASERDQCGALMELASREERVVDLIGATGVGRLMAIVRRASLVVANDSAALHMAVGFDRPLVGLYGPTRVERVGPWRRERDVIQHVREGERLDHKDERLGRAMMERITVEEVVRACVARISRGGVRSRA